MRSPIAINLFGLSARNLVWAAVFTFSLLFVAESHAQAPAQAAPATPGNIIARSVRGNVFKTVSATNARTAVVDNDPISQGMVITTEANSSLVLVFDNGASVSLQGDSELNIAEFLRDPLAANVNFASLTEEPTRSTTRLNLTRGELVGKVARLKTEQGSSFTVQTPVGAAGIRGTTFRIVYRPAGNGQAFFSMTTVEGNVEVTLATGTVAAPVAVTDNQEVVLAEVTVTVAADGTTTVALPTGQTTVISAPAAIENIQQSQAAAQTIAQSVADIVLPTVGPIVAPPSPPPAPPAPEPEPPPPTPTLPTPTPAPDPFPSAPPLTPGAGGLGVTTV